MTLTYDRAGRLKQAAGSVTTDIEYDSRGLMTNETFNGLSVTNLADAFGRRTRTGISNYLASRVTLTYDEASRLKTAVMDGSTATYGYVANSHLVHTITTRKGTHGVNRTNKHDYLNRLVSVSTVGTAAGAPGLSFGYQYDDGNLRTRVTQADGSYWMYEYDKLGQVKSARRYWKDGSAARPVR